MTSLLDLLSQVERGTAEEGERAAAERRPFIITSGAVLDVDQFVETFGGAFIRTALDASALPNSVASTTVRQYVNEWCRDPPPDTGILPYAFHDVTGHDEDVYDVGALKRNGESGQDPLFDFVFGVPLPDFFMELSQSSPCVAARLALGPRGTFADLHSHGAALNHTLCGEKRWRIYHPYVTPSLLEIARRLRVSNRFAFLEQQLLPLAEAATGDLSQQIRDKYVEWSNDGLCPQLEEGDPLWHTPLPAEFVRGISFVQRAGEVVCLPPRWAHAVENRTTALCRIYELEAPSEAVKRLRIARREDSRGASIELHPGCRVCADSGGVFTEKRSPVDPVALEVISFVDGERSAADIANRCSDPDAALALLEAQDGVLFRRRREKVSFQPHDWEEMYRTGRYAEAWESAEPSKGVVRFLALGRVPVGSKILDVGCGSGRDVIHLATTGFSAHGLDVSQAAIGLAKVRAANAGLHVDLRCESVTHSSFSTSSMAAVFDRGCLENLPPDAWPAYFAEVDRILRAGGWLLIVETGSPRSNLITPIRRELLAPFGDKFEIRECEDGVESRDGPSSLGFALLVSKGIGSPDP